MPEETSPLDAKTADALEATRAFVQVLDTEQLVALGQHVRTIQQALESRDIKTALHLHKVLSSLRGPGSLSDVFAGDQQRFDQAWSVYGKAMGNLRLFLKYGFDRPRVGS